MTDNFEKNAILKFLEGNYSYNDYLKVKSWFRKANENEEIKEQLFAQWKSFVDSESDNETSLDHIFEKVQYNILLEEKKQSKTRSLWQTYQRIAAVLLLPFLALSAWYFISTKTFNSKNQSDLLAQSWVEVNAPEGARVEFFLPDSSSGWLNSGSKLKYPARFSRNRKVELEGEAWFNVKHLDESEFVVGVTDMDIKVLGTKFNVSAYADDSFTDVTLNEGKVEITGKAASFNASLLPNEKISFNRTERTLKQSKVDANRYSAWKEGYLIIEDEPLGQIVGRMERWYNVEITIEDDLLKNYRFKATFIDEPIEEVLRLMAKTTPIKYQIEKRVVDSNGILKTKKVTIKLK